MHKHDARVEGEDQRRLDILSAWREAPALFTTREKAARALTEAVTRIPGEGVSDRVWDDAAMQFDQQQVVRLLLAVATINVWNRLAVSLHQGLPERT
jgi:alkylhydroperoxidase family enzyme